MNYHVEMVHRFFKALQTTLKHKYTFLLAWSRTEALCFHDTGKLLGHEHAAKMMVYWCSDLKLP